MQKTTYAARTTLLTAAALLAASSLAPQAFGDAAVNFNTIGDLDANFNHTATLPFAEADGVGVAGSRGLQITGTTDSGATYKNGSLSFNTAGQALGVSAFFKTAATIGLTGEDRIFELNLVSLNTNIVTGAHTGIGAKIEFVPNADGFDDIGIEFRRDNADAAGGASQTATDLDVKPNTWYKATFIATNNGTAAPIPATMTIDEYNADGTTLVAANVFNHAFDIPIEAAFTADADVFGAFRVRNGARLLAAVDNFEQFVYLPFHPGDVDADGDVDMTDFAAIQNHFQQSVAMRSEGDVNNDGKVDFRDFRQWKDNFPFTPPAAPSSGGVPEPAAALLALIAAALLGVRRK